MKNIITPLIASLLFASMGTAQAWKHKGTYKYPRYPYGYRYAMPYNPYINPYARLSPYAYPQAYRRNPYFNVPMFSGRNNMPWNQFGGTSFSNGFPMMNGFNSPVPNMTPFGFGSPFPTMSPMGFASPFPSMSPMGFSSPFGSNTWGNRFSGRRFMPW